MSRIRLACTLGLLLLAAAIPGFAEDAPPTAAPPAAPPITEPAVRAANLLNGLDLTGAEIGLVLPDLLDQRSSYLALHAKQLPNSVPPAVRYDPWTLAPGTQDKAGNLPAAPARFAKAGPQQRPANLDDLAFADIATLSRLIHDRKISCAELTQWSLDRLVKYDPQLHCVITLLPERALARARELDAMLARGKDLGPLHGIPCGVKDLFALAGAPTTWGAEPYRDQVIDQDATVVSKLDKAGAVIVAKFSLGALAMDDVWIDGVQTRNPWNLEKGSSGSSAGSACAVSAGLVPFAIGTETWGSIVSPSSRCGVTGLRPTYGRISRDGAMALSWSMDKVGPIARTVEDCAIVMDAIRGPDGRDPNVTNAPFPYDTRRSLKGLRVGYLKKDFIESRGDSLVDAQALAVIEKLCTEQGAAFVPVELPLDKLGVDIYALAIILTAEAGAAFQDLTLSNRDDQLSRQGRGDWPNIFRSAQYIPAVEYVQANRQRTVLLQLMNQLFEQVDVIVTPSLTSPSLLITNLTGHPQVCVPSGEGKDNPLASIGFIGRLNDEATVLAAARAFEQATPWHNRHPEGWQAR
jgi:Asp-tRNA(Asn)/Glu-tRNA(Gln) amidotransferase A subunit family amidase